MSKKRGFYLISIIISLALLAILVYAYGGTDPAIHGHSSQEVQFPAGAVMAFATTTCPSGWEDADGSSLSSSTYPELYAAIGEIYGDGGDGIGGNFNIPDYRGQFLRGIDDSAGNDPNAASRTDRGDGTGGDVVGSKQTDAMQDWEARFSLRTGDTGGGAAFFESGGVSIQYEGGGTRSAYDYQGTALSTMVSIKPSIHSAARTSLETRPKNINVNYCIKT